MNPDNNNSQAEHHIETVLAALRQAEPTPGMEQRINAALLRKAEAAPSRWAWLVGLRQVAGVAAVLAAAVPLSVHLYRPHAALHPQQQAVVSTQSQGAHGRSVEALPSAMIARHVTNVTQTSSPRLVRVAHTAEAAPNDSAHFPGQQAEQSFPAPPLPLTEQERLLVQLVHRDDPVELAQLTPAAREAQLERHREQVHEFFKAPPMLAANFTLEPYPTPGGTQ